MKSAIIGRENEKVTLDNIMATETAQLVAVYGRRRVGKTFLIKEYFNNRFDFYATGIFEGRQQTELKAFCQGFGESPTFNPKNWMDAFIMLRDFLKKKRKKNIIVFLDELPWFDVPPGSFLKAFEWFWNSWGSTRKGLKFFVCGSSTSWMINKFISGKGGLYNRTTARINLSPFNLYETELFLNAQGINWAREQILETYMTFGGVPYYLGMLNPNKSLPQNIDGLLFGHNALLKNEYDFLLNSLFKDADYYKNILDTLATKNKGLTRNEIINLSRINNNGVLTKALKNLMMSDFIREYSPFGKKRKESLFQLTDPFVLFYKRFVASQKSYDDKYWTNILGSSRYHSWKGIAFESVCLLHSSQIKRSLGIYGMVASIGSWYFKGDQYEPGAQIDMLIDRADKIINVCEMKYASQPYEVTAEVEKKIRERNAIFLSVTKTRSHLLNVLITPFGIKRGKYAQLFNNIIDMDALFTSEK